LSKKIGAQVNMVSSSWDGKRLINFITAGELDKKGADKSSFKSL